MVRFFLYTILSLLFFSVVGQVKYNFIVTTDGTGDFKTIQEAINAVPDYRKVNTVIFIRNGTYKEKLVLPESKNLVTFIGESIDKTILTYDDFALKKNVFNEEKGTSGSASFYIYGNDFRAENISFQNSSGPVGQAVAVLVKGDRIIFRNCRFLGFQDTLYTYGRESRQYYINCYIEGTVDFIFGSATAVFDSCRIFCKSQGYVTAASTPEQVKYGYVFRYCKLEGTAPPSSVFLGRPWRPFAKTVFLFCDMPAFIKAEGWHNWNNAANERTVFYAEYKNSGKASGLSKRVSWSRQLTDEQSAVYTLENIFADWKPVI